MPEQYLHYSRDRERETNQTRAALINCPSNSIPVRLHLPSINIHMLCIIDKMCADRRQRGDNKSIVVPKNILEPIVWQIEVYASLPLFIFHIKCTWWRKICFGISRVNESYSLSKKWPLKYIYDQFNDIMQQQHRKAHKHKMIYWFSLQRQVHVYFGCTFFPPVSRYFCFIVELWNCRNLLYCFYDQSIPMNMCYWLKSNDSI